MEVARKLALQERMVRYHVEQILDKLVAKNRTEAVHIGLQQGRLTKIKTDRAA
jgi:DNA-binding NarL/FixJ family response regulator